jgi:hypothetical protein
MKATGVCKVTSALPKSGILVVVNRDPDVSSLVHLGTSRVNAEKCVYFCITILDICIYNGLRIEVHLCVLYSENWV